MTSVSLSWLTRGLDMVINGREIRFLRTVLATCKIAEICKDGNIENAGTLFEGRYQDSQKTTAKFIAIMSEGYEMNKKFEEPGYEPRPLTAEEALNLTEKDFDKCFREAVEAYTGEKITVQSEPVKGKKKAAAKSN